MRKSSVTSRSSLPSGALSCQTTSVGLGLLRAEVLALHAVAGAEQVLEEVLVALAARAEQVGAPDEQVARPVVRVVRVGAAHLQRAVLERLDRVVLRVDAGGLRVADDLQRIGLQLRRRRQPAHALGAHVVVDHAAGVRLLVGQRRDALPPCPASRSATGRCARRRSWCCSSAAAGGSSRARRPAPSSRSAAAAFPGRRNAPSRRRSGRCSRTSSAC